MQNISFIQPKFKFLIVMNHSSLSDVFEHKKNINDNYFSLECYAEGYEIKDNGSITFYHHISNGDKLNKIPVFSLSHGEWKYCALINSTELQIFNGQSTNYDIKNHSQISNNELESDIIPEKNSLQKENLNIIPNNKKQKTQFTLPTNLSKHELEKQRDELIGELVHEFLKKENKFILLNFMAYLRENTKDIPFTETDVSWVIVNLIKDREIFPQKFIQNDAQKIMDMHLPGILKRHWDGKIAPIMNTLGDKDETRNISQIDLIVWLVLNNYT